MSSRSLVPPLFAIPPTQYEPRYFADMIRAFSAYTVQQQQPGEGRQTTIVLTDLQTTDVGLEVGTLFDVEGFVKICRANNPHVAGNQGTSSVGAVTVVTT